MTDTLRSLPMNRSNPFDPPNELTSLTSTEPLSRLRYPDGHVGWLVTGYDLACAVLADGRFSSRSEFKRMPVRRPGTDPFYGHPALPGWLVDMDRPEHTRIRRALGAHFTDRRIRAGLTGSVTGIVRQCLRTMSADGPTADLVQSFALPVPSLVICELLGVPVAERAEFQHQSGILFSLDSMASDASAAMRSLDDFLRILVAHRRTDPGPDVLSSLVIRSDLTTPEIAGAGVLLLTAGHETTANSISLSVFTLLCDPEQRARLPLDAMDGAVEELLRYLTVFHFGVPRAPLEDVEIAGELIRKGESVTVSLSAANRDPGRFPQPHVLDLRRSGPPHLAFGYGMHKCIGRRLALLEMRIALHGLFTEFPSLRLACRPDEVPLAVDMGIYGVHALPVSW